MSSTKLSNFPIPIVAFGKISYSSLEKLQENTTSLNSLAKVMSSFTSPLSPISSAMENAGNYVPKLTNPGKYADLLTDVITVMGKLLTDVDELHKELQNIDQKHSNTVLEGKMDALNGHLGNLRDGKTSDSQKMFEIVAAISHMDELLSVFSTEKSIFRGRYYYGAPLFAHFCGILKAIALIAVSLPGYNTSNLLFLKTRYQAVLDWYRRRCIGRRLASCYIMPMLAVPGVERVYDWDRHYKTYSEKKYYEESTLFPWIKYADDLGGTGWRVWSAPILFAKAIQYCSIVDTWDIRDNEEVAFVPLEVPQESILNHNRRANILAEYRSQVHDIMETFFEDLSLLAGDAPIV